MTHVKRSKKKRTIKAEPDLSEADMNDSNIPPKSRSTVKHEHNHHATVVSSGKFEPLLPLRSKLLFDESTDDDDSVKKENNANRAVKVEPKSEPDNDMKDTFEPIDSPPAGKKRLFDEMAKDSDDESRFSANENGQDTNTKSDPISATKGVVRVKVEDEIKKYIAKEITYGDCFLLARQSYVKVEIAGKKKNITRGMLKLGGGNVSPDMWCHKDKDQVSQHCFNLTNLYFIRFLQSYMLYLANPEENIG